MDDETRAAFAALGEVVAAGFARTDRYFELQQAQYVELRGEFGELRGGFDVLRGEFGELRGQVGELRAEVAELRGEVAALRAEVGKLADRMDALESRISGLETEVILLRDYVTREIAAIRGELRELRLRSDQNDELRREIAELTARVDRLERSQQD